jgi:hypothetical protein
MRGRIDKRYSRETMAERTSGAAFLDSIYHSSAARDGI